MLSERELEVLAHLAEGLSNQAIAARLGIAERTVECHVSRTFTKLDLPEDASTHRRVLVTLVYLAGT